MIKMTYEQFRVLNGARALGQKLLNTPLPPAMGYGIKKIFEKLNQAGKKINDEFIALQLKLQEEYGVRNEDGTLKRPEGQPEGFEVAPDKTEAYQAALKAFDGNTFELDRPALLEQAWLNGNMQLSAAEWTAMEPLFVEGSTEQAELNNVKSIHQKALNDTVQSSQSPA